MKLSTQTLTFPLVKAGKLVYNMFILVKYAQKR